MVSGGDVCCCFSEQLRFLRNGNEHIRFLDGLGTFPCFTRFVNAVLDRERADGTWKQRYGQWLGRFGPAPDPPPAEYRD